MDNIFGFLFVNGAEAIGVIKEEPSIGSNRYEVEDIVGVVTESNENKGTMGIRFVPISVIAEPNPTNPLIIRHISLPDMSLIGVFPPKKIILDNYLALKSNIVLPGVTGTPRYS